MKTLTLAEATAIMDNNGGNLDLRGTPITSLPDNLAVSGYLDLCGTQITSLPDNLALGRKVYSDIGFKCDNHCKLKDGEYAPNRYLYADGILTHVKGKKSIKGYDFYIGKIKGKNVVSDGTHYAHCSTLQEGVADLLFKSAKDRGAKQYSHLTLDSEVTAEDAITMYRVITGACRQGTQRFVDGLGKLKDKYTVREIISITQGQYNSEAFREFFTTNRSSN